MFAALKYGTRFRIGDIEYEIRRQVDQDFEVLNKSYNLVELLTHDQITTEYMNDNLYFKEENQMPFDKIEHDLSQYSDAQKDEMLKRFSVIKPMLEGRIKKSEVRSYLENYPMEERPASSKDLSPASFYRWLNKWYEHEDIRFLCPQPPGPKKRRVNGEALNRISEEVHKADKKGEITTDRQLYIKIEKMISDDNILRGEKDKLSEISESTFRRIRKEIGDPYARNVIIFGRAKADLLQNGVRSETVTTRPLEIIELDWTPLDWLIKEFNFDERLRPTLIHAVDKHTDEPWGFHVIFKEHPNAQDLKQCLLNGMMPKSYLKERYPLVQKDWTAYGIPETIRLDNAKINDCRDFEEICSFLNIGLQYCEVQSGHQKGTIEGALGNLNKKLFHSVEGTLFSNPEQRGQYDSYGKACVSMKGLYHIIHILLVDLVTHVYNRGRRGIPHHLWENGLIENKVHRKLPYKKQYLHLLMSTKAVTRKITPKGIELLGEFFFSDELNNLRHRLDREKGDTTVLVRYGDADLRTIYIRDEKEKRYIEAYPRKGGLENKKIDRNYPVHSEILAYICNQNNKNYNEFDTSDMATAYENVQEVIKQEKAEDRKIKRQRNREKANGDTVPSAIDGVPQEFIPAADKSDLIKDIEEITSQKIKSDEISPKKVTDSEISLIEYSKPGTEIVYDEEVDLDKLASQWGVNKKGAVNE
ncbi:DDE-type integrase/transposase/recombinase [Paenibacillus sp. LMG 31458]|uniref:DDE-type integrase/transposase/recombinase n=1 Tax=Paenibacillus phytorum TaxID=2654977 RepID=A0ABX1Y353_9BACL|nr:Mu transposase C-terminal domain-containing protein [Paenibacillus phytorum]NOU75315.1 DDE-type integrase/transposase/recombinase [Paenibacillus phytorum]